MASSGKASINSCARCFCTRAGLSNDEVYQLVAPRRTLNRREAEQQALSPEEADRAVRVACIVARAQQIFSAKPGLRAGVAAARADSSPQQRRGRVRELIDSIERQKAA